MKKYTFPFADENGKCHDCGVSAGEWHHDGCDVERCPFAWRQRISCDCGNCKQLALTDKVPFGFESKEVLRAVEMLDHEAKEEHAS